MVMLFLCPVYRRDSEVSHIIRAMKQTCRTVVSWSFCLAMEACRNYSAR